MLIKPLNAVATIASVLFMMVSCADMKQDIQDLENRLDALEGTKIVTVDEQIKAINTSIADLKEADKALETYVNTLVTTSLDLQKQISDANAEIAKLKSGVEDDSDVQALVKELESMKDAVESELASVNELIEQLKAADGTLDKKITVLQSYVDETLAQELAEAQADAREWANATFATLKQYEQAQAAITSINALIGQINTDMTSMEARLNEKISKLESEYKGSIDATVSQITSAYTSAISAAKAELITAFDSELKAAISESEAGMKAWVNALLTEKYYDINTIDAKLSALTSKIDNADSDLLGKINEYKSSLAEAKTELTEAYRNAITEAIETNNAVINTAIAKAVEDMEAEVQIELDRIDLALSALQDQLNDLENDFKNRIQSLRFMPEYSDRTVPVSDMSRTFTLDFLVTPANLATGLADAWQSDNNIISAYLRYTKLPETRAASEAVSLVVSSVTATAEGDLSVVVKESASEPFSEAFLSGECPAVVYVKVSDGNNEVISDLVDIRAYKDKGIDLSAEGTANSYIVSGAGRYRFLPKRGNANITYESVVASVEVLWESYGTSTIPSNGALIANVAFDEGYITFDTPATFREGNAVIAAKNADDSILWSWHIWLTDEPQPQVYKNDAGVMMDRNLGALSSEKTSHLSSGLLYQWGRKDPFLGAVSMSSNSPTLVASSANWPEPVESTASTGSIYYSTKNPMTFITSNTYNKDWIYTGDTTTDATRWTRSKSVYDPCPPGWKVPAGGSEGIWNKAGNFTTTSSHWDYSYHTYYVTFTDPDGQQVTANYPAAPYRMANGEIYEPEEAEGWCGYYWASTSEVNEGYVTRFDVLEILYPGKIFPTWYIQGPARAHSVRCCKE